MDQKVNVAIKCRPLSATERLEETFDFFINDKNSVTTLKSKYEFKHIFTPESTAKQIFDSIIIPMLEKALLGFNGTVLAYGQTGSGKTYTLGTELTSYHKGITQMILNHLFHIPGLQLKISVLEIYLKDCYDLLHATPLKMNIQSLKPVSVVLHDADNLETAMELLTSAVKNRRVGATASNKRSSRSHMIITLYIESFNNVSKFNIVDLAGSEKIQASTGTLRNEGVAINEALLSLGRVVNCLAQAKSHIPFRDSPLTHLLEDSLNRDNYITLIGCINSLKKNLEESEKTLEFASKFAGISASRVVLGTPYKTPSRYIINNTFSGSVFKKPLTPFNKTIATTPISWESKMREQPQESNSRRDTLNSSNVSLNLSNASTSTALPENSPPVNRMDSFSSALSVACNAVSSCMTPANLDTLIKTTVEQAIKTSQDHYRATIKKEITQIFRRQLNLFEQKENTPFTNRLLEIGDTYGTTSESSPAHDSSDSSSDLQRTVLGCEDFGIPESEAPPSEEQSESPSKMPNISSSNTLMKSGENLNGSYISGFDPCSPNIQSEVPDQEVNLESSSVVFKQPAPRRSARLSIMNSFFGGTLDRNGDATDSGMNSAPDSEVVRKPQIRRCLRRSVLSSAFEESESDEASGNKGGDTDSGTYSAPDSQVFKKPQLRRFARRNVLKKPHEESESDDACDNRDSGVCSEADVSKRAPRRSMRLSIKRPFESEPDSLVNKVRRRSLRVSLMKIDDYDSEKPNQPRGKKAANNRAGSTQNISHEKRILKILQEGSLKELLKLPTVGSKTAALILNDRLLHGPLKTVKDFANIRGITTNQGQKFLWANSLI